VAAVELACLLPFLAFLFVIAVDWARVFYYTLTVTNCARNGALYASDPVTQANSPYASISDAALADAANLSPAPTVTSAAGSSDGSAYVEVTVTFPFATVTNFPGVPSNTSITRTVRMNIAPRFPN
jgi:Flp pilus assembly protein TadG